LHELPEEVRRCLRELEPATVLRQANEEAEREALGRHAALGIRRLRRVRRRVALAHDAEEPLPRVVRGEALHERRFDVLAAAASLALPERGESAVERRV